MFELHKKGTIRANHYHKKDEHFIYIMDGKNIILQRQERGAKLNYKIMKRRIFYDI